MCVWVYTHTRLTVYLLLYLCELCEPQATPSLSALMCDCSSVQYTGHRYSPSWVALHKESHWCLALPFFHFCLFTIFSFCLWSLFAVSLSLLIYNGAVYIKVNVGIKSQYNAGFFFSLLVFFVCQLYSVGGGLSGCGAMVVMGGDSAIFPLTCTQIGASYCLEQYLCLTVAD